MEATQRLGAGERERAERLARYATRVVLATGKVRRLEGGRVRIETPPDPRTGRTWLELDELEFVHAVCQQVPARGLHLVRYQGVYANRLRRAYREARARLAGEVVPAGAVEERPSAWRRSSAPHRRARPRRSGARRGRRMLRKVFEVDPLVCPRCRREGVTVEMEIVAWITDLDVVDRILKHRRERGLESVFETPPARAPPVV